MAKLVSKVYGDALFEAAREQKSLDTLFEEAKALKTVFQENQELIGLLNHPQIVKEEKLSIMGACFQNRISDEMMGFLTTVVDKGRQKDLPAILTYFTDRVKEFKKIGTASVTTAVELSAAQKKQVTEKLLAVTEYVEFEMQYLVDPSLIGGMVIRIGDRVVDSSIKTQLRELKRRLMSVQLS